MSQPLHIFSWTKELETGIELIDKQHKAFMMQANRFIIKVMSNKIDEGIKEEFDFLNGYLLYHFQAEETYILDSGYEDYRGHQAEHLRIKFEAKKLEEMMYTAKSQEELAEKMMDFINLWVVSHIMESDLEFAKYYKEKSQEKENSLTDSGNDTKVDL